MKYAIAYCLLFLAPTALAEPYLAVQSGQTCSVCHTNPTGGGKRTAYGNQFAQQLAARPLMQGQSEWTGAVFKGLSMGGNARVGARQFDSEDRDDNLAFDVDRVSLYLDLKLSESISFYIDQQVAPGGSLNREAWARLTWGNTYLKAGKFFLPLGWRLEDDSAFIRKLSGVNFNSSDNGIEFGFSNSSNKSNNNSFNFQVALSNGTGGASEIDDGKLFSARAEWVHANWRVGASGLFNNTDLGERTILGIFAGLKTGPVSWIAEYDRIEDEGFGLPDSERDVSLIEANIGLWKGHNLKFTFEGDMSDGNSDRYRNSIVYEMFPLAFTQVRLGFRVFEHDGNSTADADEAFLQLHVYF